MMGRDNWPAYEMTNFGRFYPVRIVVDEEELMKESISALSVAWPQAIKVAPRFGSSLTSV